MRFFSPGAMRSKRVAGCTVTFTSGPESGVSVIEVPLIALIAPIRRADEAAGAVCACAAGGAAAATASGEASVLAAKNKQKMVAGKIVAGKIIDRMDVLVLFIRPLLIYMRFWRLSG